MADEVVVPFDDKTQDNAVLLLAAAEDLGLDASVVRTSEGAFVVPQEVHDRAFGKEKAESETTEKPGLLSHLLGSEHKPSRAKRRKSESEES